MDELMNLVRREAERAMRSLASPRSALVTSYDPVAHAVKVTYPVTGAESGWMPVRHAVVGAGWGIVCGAPIGAQVVVDFLDGDIDCPFVSGFLNSAPDTPQTVPSGEIVLRHAAGAVVHLANSGHITLTDPAGSVIDLQNNGTIAVTAASVVVNSSSISLGS